MRYQLSKSMDASKASVKFNQLLADKKNIELGEVRLKRSIKQNAYLHVLITLFAIEFGYTLSEAKILLKREAGLTYKKSGNIFLKQTSKMDSKELSEFVDWIRNYAGVQGLYLPTSEEYITGQISIDKTISQHKEYL